MTVVTSDNNPVGAMQEQLASSLLPRKPRLEAASLSRTAHLHLTNRLARFIPFSLGLLAMMSIYLLALAAPALSANMGVWIGMLFLGLVHSARETYSYRAGEQIASARPLRWRANHTACMAILGTIIATGTVLLPALSLPFGLPLPLYLCAFTFVAALFQHWHRLAAFSLFAPIALVNVVLPIFENSPVTHILLPTVLSVTLIAAFATILWHSTQRAMVQADAQYPRTKTYEQTDFVAPVRRISLQRNNYQTMRRTA